MRPLLRTYDVFQEFLGIANEYALINKSAANIPQCTVASADIARTLESLSLILVKRKSARCWNFMFKYTSDIETLKLRQVLDSHRSPQLNGRVPKIYHHLCKVLGLDNIYGDQMVCVIDKEYAQQHFSAYNTNHVLEDIGVAVVKRDEYVQKYGRLIEAGRWIYQGHDGREVGPPSYTITLSATPNTIQQALDALRNETANYLKNQEQNMHTNIHLKRTVFPSDEKTIQVENDPIYGGAHKYTINHSLGFGADGAVYNDDQTVIQFVQKNDDGTIVSGLQSEQLALVLLDRTKKLDDRFPSEYNKKMIEGLEMFLGACESRVQERIDRGVMGKLEK